MCIIAPVSSWAAAVTSSVPEGSGINGFTMFLRTIPYNYYALLTIVMSLFLIFTGTDYCSMKQHEDNARAGDLFTTADRPYGDDVDAGDDAHGHVIDLVAPVLVLIAACIFGLIYTGGFFEGVDFITAFSDCNASAGLVLGSSIALMFTFVFYRVRSVMTFQDFAACIPEGFKAMVSPMLILTLAWTLSGMTNLLGAKYYVANLLGGSAAALQYLLPVIIFLVAVFLAFATGTSWGTFSILIPIVCHAFPQGEMLVVSIAACLSGAVCGDHCSPISDTTIMASAGAQCDHLNHVSTQLPYAITAASCSAACYVITGLTQMFLGSSASLWTSLILLGVAIVLELVVLNILRVKLGKKRPKRDILKEIECSKGDRTMLEKAFNDVYTKFKLHFYQNVFQRFATREATLTTVESFCMEGIMAMGEPTIAEFSRMMQISTPNAAYKIGSLVRKGYVEKIQSTTDRREYHLRPTQKYIDYYNISYSYLSTVVQRVNKRFPKEDVKKLEQMLTIISNELMPELNLENNPEAPEEKKTAR